MKFESKPANPSINLNSKKVRFFNLSD